MKVDFMEVTAGKIIEPWLMQSRGPQADEAWKNPCEIAGCGRHLWMSWFWLTPRDLWRKPDVAAKVTEAQFCSHFPFMQETGMKPVWSQNPWPATCQSQRVGLLQACGQISPKDISDYELTLILQRYYNSETAGINYVVGPAQFQKSAGLDLIIFPCGIPLFMNHPKKGLQRKPQHQNPAPESTPQPSNHIFFRIIKPQAMDKDLQALIEEPFQERPSINSLNSGEWITVIYLDIWQNKRW